MSLPRYPEYKESGVEWLGEIPTHWTVTRVQDVAKVINGHPFDARLFEPDGAYPLIRIRDLDSRETATCYNGEFVAEAAVTSLDVLIGMDGDFNVGRWLGDSPALLNQRMCCIRTERRSLATMLRFALPAPLNAINDITYATTVKHLSSFQVQKLRIGLPSDELELSTIATFLDRETAKIDALIAEQEKLLLLLAEKRQATISHAVTKGLNPEVPMKESGVEWLGEVPAHWRTGKIQNFARRESGHTPSRQHPEWWENCTIPWFTLADVWQLRTGNVKYVFETKELVSELGLANSSARLLPAGTVMLSRTASVGYSAIMGCAMATTQDFINWVCKSELTPDFLLYVLRGMRCEFDRLMMGSTHQTIYMPDVARLMMGLPPLEEQAAIVAFLDAETSRLDNLTAESARAITLLKERRTALISAAVTGKIDVRNIYPVEASCHA